MREEIKRWLNNVRLGHFNERALVVVGGKSSGKTTFSLLAAKLVGLKPEHRIVVDAAAVRSMFFVDSVRNFPMVVIDCEPDDVNDILTILKPVISNRSVQVDRLGKSAVVVNNQMNFMILTNNYEPKQGERRVIAISPLFGMNVLAEI
nr:MAG TPA: FleN-like [Caudoviricetes sp.]